jgi:beta-lysine N6-acetyltransferase
VGSSIQTKNKGIGRNLLKIEYGYRFGILQQKVGNFMKQIDEYYVNKIIQDKDFIMHVTLDFFNDRLKMEKYRGNVTNIMLQLEKLAKENQFTKSFVKVHPEDWQQFLSRGYITEAIFTNYYSGRDAYSMGCYYDLERKTSDYWVVEDDTLLQVKDLPQKADVPKLPDGYIIRRATLDNAEALSELYKAVFEIYPTPVSNPLYLRQVMSEDTIFYVVEKDGIIVSAASAEINREYNNAEITDCATLQSHRKHGLMKIIIELLEEELYNQQIFCAYSIARALSFGMNAVFHQRGYNYTGRLTKNCKIYDKFEDMNVWMKNLSIK